MASRMQEPPEKRRKTDPFSDDFWDDDNEIFSQAVLDDIDHIVQSQQVTKNKNETNNNSTEVNQSSTVGHVSGGESHSSKTFSMNKGSVSSTKSQGYHTLSNCRSSVQNTMGHSRKSNMAESGQSSATLRSCPPPHDSQSLKNPVTQKTVSVNGTSQFSNATGNQFSHVMKQKLKTVEEENNFLKGENQKLKDSQYGKDGEIKHLRTKLAQVESDRFKDRQEKMQLMEQQTREQSEKEKRLEREIEKSKTDRQFMEREIDELKERCRRQERQLRTTEGTSPVRAAPFQSPTKSQRLAPGSPRTPSRTGGAGGFPTKGTFMKEETSPKKNGKKSANKSEVDKATQISTPNTLTAPERPHPALRMRLRVAQSKGRITGPQLVDKLVENINPESEGETGAPSNFKQGLFSLLQHPITLMDVSTMRVERDVLTMTFKPTAAPRVFGSEVDTVVRDLQEVNNQHNVAMAQQAISYLLKQYGSESHPPSVHSPITMDLHTCTTTHAVLILPLLETIFDNYIDTMISLNTTLASSAESTATGHSSIDSSVSSLASGVQSMALKGASYLNGVEERTVCALKVLQRLVAYSAPVRLVLFCDKHLNSPSIVGQLEPSQGTSQERIDADSEQEKVSNELSQLDNTARQVAKNCDILNKLLALANPVEFNNSLGNVSVTEGSMQVLSVLAESMPSPYHDRLVPLFTQESLLNCLNGEHFLDQNGGVKSTHVMVTLITSAVQLMTSLIQASHHYLQYLCSLDEDCLLLCMYQCCLDSIDSLDPLQRQTICLQVYECISTLMSRHRRGSLLFIDRRCQCSSELVKCMVITLRRELLLYQQTTSPLTSTNTTDPATANTSIVSMDNTLLAFLHRGLALFHALTMRDSLFTSHHEEECKHEFVELLCNVHRVLREMPDSEQKAMLLDLMPDLWDVHMDYPESNDDYVDPVLFGGKDNTASASTSRKGDEAMCIE